MAYYVYILKCSDGTLYTGFAKNIQKRIATHRAGKGAKYVRARLPVELLYTEEFEDKISAYRREYEIKSWSRGKKIKLLGLTL